MDFKHPITLNDLPQEILLQIFSKLDAEDLTKVCCTCKVWNHVASDNMIWDNFYLGKFGRWEPSVFDSISKEIKDTNRFTKDLFLKKLPIQQNWKNGIYTKTYLTAYPELDFADVFQFSIIDEVKYMVTAHQTGTFKIWKFNALNPKLDIELLHKLEIHRGIIWWVEIRKHIALTAGADGQVRVIDIKQGTVLQTLKGATRSLWSLDCLIEHDIVAGGGDNGITDIWELSTGKMINQIDIEEPVYDLALLSDGDRMIIASYDGFLNVWSIKQQKCVYSLEKQHGGTVICLRKEENILLSSATDGSVAIWDLHNLKCSAKVQANGSPWSLLLYENFLIAGCLNSRSSSSDATYVRVWDFSNMKKLYDIPYPTNNFLRRVTCLRVLEDKLWCASAGITVIDFGASSNNRNKQENPQEEPQKLDNEK